MKGNLKIIARLNELLSDELTAINQYMVHAEMCSNWGYKKLHDVIKQRAVGEMKHAERLIERILFLEGTPAVGALNKISIGKNIAEQFKNDSYAESEAIIFYNNSIRLAEDNSDEGTAALLRSILTDEEKHLDWLETQSQLVEQISLKNYLVEQTD